MIVVQLISKCLSEVLYKTQPYLLLIDRSSGKRLSQAIYAKKHGKPEAALMINAVFEPINAGGLRLWRLILVWLVVGDRKHYSGVPCV